jgi:hypothetical protein
MKIKSDIRAGATYTTYEQCNQAQKYWKQQAQLMEQYSNNVNAGPPSGLVLPSTVPPSGGGSYGGGYVNGVYYADKSGVCGGTTTKPPTTGGGYVGGVYYSDKSGVCG